MEIDLNSKWKSAKGDETLALQWAIESHSLVWEIGGFEGRWASQIANIYDPYITIFEPTKFGFGKCSALFFDNDKVDVRHYGLWVMSESLPLYNPGNDGGSLFLPHAVSEVCIFRDVYVEVEDLERDVDLCLMNIEGAEFFLLPYMIANDLMKNIRLFWCQFHDFVPFSEERFLRIHDGLKRTHKVMWNYYPTAVAWERR